MKLAIQVPLKGTPSQRLPGKNFMNLAGKKLCFWLLDELHELTEQYDVYVDSESPEVLEMIENEYHGAIKTHQRHEWFAGDDANGNHLINQFALLHPEYDAYAQAHVTSVNLDAETILDMVEAFKRLIWQEHDSLIAVTDASGWYRTKAGRINGDPLRPGGMRTQDEPVYREANFHCIRRGTVFYYGCRVGKKPYLYKIPRIRAIEVDTEEDLQEAEEILAGRIGKK